VAVGAGVLLLAAVLAWTLWPASGTEPRPRAYRDVSACLLTDGKALAGPSAAAVWSGMRAASARTHGQVRFLAVSGAQSVQNAQSFVGTLILGHCAVVVAEPGIADGAVRAVAAQYPDQRFLVVGGPQPASANVTRAADSSVTDAVASALTAGS
jgi:hypothetical protein